ncbi:MAG: starch-binding protein [Oscillospiraceae bacterium]|nr:starch-binding protein [Oscillospiraceae bacterium]
MNKKTIRIICLILVGLMVLGLIPVIALASANVASATVNGVTTGYDTVQAAVDAAAAGNGTVTILADVELEAPVSITSGTVTIDLAGFRLANYVYGENNHVLYVNGGTLTVTDTSAAKTGTLTPNGSSIFNAGVHVASGSAIIDGVICDGGQCALSIDDGTMIINDVTTDEDISINGGTLTVNGGNMEGLDMSGGETIVNGGTFSTTSGIAYLIYLNGGNITVNGGLWKFCDNYGIRFNNGDSFCTIKGGIYTNGLKMSAAYNTGLDIYLPDILETGYNLYDDAGAQIELTDTTKKVKGYVAVAQESPGARVFNVTYKLTGLTSSNTSTTLQKGFSLFVNLIPEEGYAAPETIRIMMGGKILYSSKYSYSNGFLMLMSSNITDDFEIIATGVESWTYTVEGLTGYTDKVMSETDGIYTKTFAAVPAGEDYEIFVKGTSISSTSQTPAVNFGVSADCDVTVTYDSATGEVTVTGDYVTQEVITHRVVYFDNSSKNWSKVNIYAWNDDGAVVGAWPGTAMSLLDGTSNIYYYILPIEAVNVIFNDGSSQTDDLTLPDMSLNMYDASGNWVYYEGDVTVCGHPSHGTDGNCTECGANVGHNYVNGLCACGAVEPEEPEVTTRVVYFQNTAGWSQPYIYAWTTTNGATTNYVGAWPGAAMTKVEGVENLYCYTISAEAANVIFHNNSGTQTDDLVLPTDGKDCYNYAGNTWSTYEPAPCQHPSHDQTGACTSCGEAVAHTISDVVTPPTCTVDGYTTHTCSVCGYSYQDTPVAAAHNLTYNAAVSVGCHSNGMAEYWYCDACNSYFADSAGENQVAYQSLVIASANTLQYTAPVEAVCHTNGMAEYWYCAGCDCYFTDSAGKFNIASKSLVVPAPETLTHHQAQAVSCDQDGMLEYWYCGGCDCYFTDAAGKFNIASKSLVIPATGHSFSEGVCLNCGDLQMEITAQPQDVMALIGQQAKVTVEATGEGLTYQWYYANEGVETFQKTNAFSGNAYYVSMNSTRAGRRVYCVITDQYGNSLTSDTVTLSMDCTLRILQQPTDVTAASGEMAKVTFKAYGVGLTYKWYFANKGSEQFALTSTFTGNKYTTPMNNARDGRRVYCVVTDQFGNSVTTDTVTLSMYTPLEIIQQPVSVVVASGEMAKVTVTARGDGLRYAWYFAAANEDNFAKTNTFTGKSYYTPMNAARDGRQVYCVITDRYGNSVTTDIVTLSRYTPLEITQQPVSVVVPAGKLATVTVMAKGDDLRYEWYFAGANEDGFIKTNTFTGKSYCVPMNAARNGRQVYCVITDRYGNSVTSEIVTLGMYTPLEITRQPQSVAVSMGDYAKVTVGVRGDGLTYRWYYANAGEEEFKLTTSFTTNCYVVSMTAARNGRQIYCVITDQYGNTVTTDTVTISAQ